MIERQAWRWLLWTVGLIGLAVLTLLVGNPIRGGSGLAPLAVALAGDPWLIGLRWVLLAIWIGLVLWTGWWATQPVGLVARWLERAILLLLLAGIVMPPQVIRPIMSLIARLLPFESSSARGLDIFVLGHFSFFALLATLLFSTRRDLGWLRLWGLFLALAIATELMQVFIDGRMADPGDVLVDLLGTGIGALLAAGLGLAWRGMSLRSSDGWS